MSADRPESSHPEPLAGEIADFGHETYLLHLLAAASSHRDRTLGRHFEPLGLTVDKYRSLVAVARLPGCTMKELSQVTSIDRTTLTRMVDQMVAAGWVTREHAVRDRRLVQLSLTPDGLALGRKAVRLVTDANRQAAVDLTVSEISAAARTLETVLHNLISDAELFARVITLRRPGEANG
jgi:DNA-binding MarR family transcriptional regulator